MRPGGYALLLVTGFVCASRADESSGVVSRELKSRIREGLPTFQPPSGASPAGAEKSLVILNEMPLDADVLVLPTLSVEGKRLPRDAADHLGSTRDFDRRMRNLYSDHLARGGALNAALNEFSLPLLSPSKAERGRALYLAEELNRLADLMSKEEAKSVNGMLDQVALTLGGSAPKRR